MNRFALSSAAVASAYLLGRSQNRRPDNQEMSDKMYFVIFAKFLDQCRESLNNNAC